MQKLDTACSYELQKKLKEELSQSAQLRYIHRLHCVLLLAKGNSSQDLSRWFGQTPRTLELWASKYRDRGPEGLREVRNAGRPSRLNNMQIKRLCNDLESLPGTFNYAASSWSGELIRQHLYDLFGVDMSVRQCQRLLRKLREVKN